MRIIGIDPGSRICGYGIIDEVSGNNTHVDCGGIMPKKKDPLGARLDFIYTNLKEIIATFAPDAAAIETIFFAANVKSAIVLGQARGVALLALAHAGLPIYEYSPTQIKKAVVGFGRADKDQVAAMTQALLGLSEPAMSDASDALACALCHLSSHRFHEQVRTATT